MWNYMQQEDVVGVTTTHYYWYILFKISRDGDLVFKIIGILFIQQTDELYLSS